MPKQSSNQRTTHFLVKTSYCTYYVRIDVMNKMMHRIMFGGKKKCVVISVYFDGTHPNIDAYSNGEACNIENNLVRGIGTIHLLNTAMSFVKKKYPNVPGMFELIDKSTIECMKGYDLSLATYYIAKTANRIMISSITHDVCIFEPIVKGCTHERSM